MDHDKKKFQWSYARLSKFRDKMREVFANEDLARRFALAADAFSKIIEEAEKLSTEAQEGIDREAKDMKKEEAIGHYERYLSIYQDGRELFLLEKGDHALNKPGIEEMAFLDNMIDYCKEIIVEIKEDILIEADSTLEESNLDDITFSFFLTKKGNPLLPFLQDQFFNAKTAKTVALLFALYDLGCLSDPTQVNKANLHRILVTEFKIQGTLAAFNIAINKFNNANTNQEVLIKAQKGRINKYLTNLTNKKQK